MDSSGCIISGKCVVIAVNDCLPSVVTRGLNVLSHNAQRIDYRYQQCGGENRHRHPPIAQAHWLRLLNTGKYTADEKEAQWYCVRDKRFPMCEVSSAGKIGGHELEGAPQQAGVDDCVEHGNAAHDAFFVKIQLFNGSIPEQQAMSLKEFGEVVAAREDLPDGLAFLGGLWWVFAAANPAITGIGLSVTERKRGNKHTDAIQKLQSQ